MASYADVYREWAVTNPAAIENDDPAFWEAVRSALAEEEAIEKHYGPGPHPSGTPQSVHGSGTSSPWSAPTATMLSRENAIAAFAPEARLAAMDFYRTSFASPLSEFGPDTVTDLEFLGLDDYQIPDSEVQLLRRTVARFEAAFPGALPAKTTIMYTESVDPDDPVLAWVYPVSPTSGSIVRINMHAWKDIDGQVEAIRSHNDIRLNAMAGQNYVLHSEDPVASYKEVTIFHELAHVAGASRGWGQRWPNNWDFDRWPDYSQKWYPSGPLRQSDPRIPSMYAVAGPPEFFAEALTDYHYSGEEAAAPLSTYTAQEFARYLEETP